MDQPAVVIGGTGRLGRLVVRRLLDRRERVRVLARTPVSGRRLPPAAEFHQADVRVRATLAAPLARCSAVFYCVEPGTAETGPDRPETTLYQGVRNVLDAAGAGGGRPHVVLVGQIHTTDRAHPLNAYGRMLDWRLAGEDAVRASGLPYTVVRPGWLTDDHPYGAGVRLAQGDRRDGCVSRADVAEVCVQALYCPSASGTTFEVFNEPGSAPDDWEAMFAALEWDQVPVA